jgi:hypothetical protein
VVQKTQLVLPIHLDKARELGVDPLEGRRFHVDRVRKLGLHIIRKAGRRGAAAKELKPLYKRLIRQIEGILSVAGSVAMCLRDAAASSGRRDEELAARLTQFQMLGAQVISQARRRVIEEESVPNDEKLFSVFEPHTELLKRGKAGKPIELGHMIQIQQVKKKFITDYGVYEKKPVEPALVHESDRGTKVSSAAPISYFTANEFGLPSSNIRFRMLHAISASDSCDSG